MSGVSARVIAFAAGVAVCSMAFAQLTADRLYNGVDRPIPMTVKTPAGKEGEVKIEMFAFGKETPVASAAAAEGPVNIAALFPDLWTKKSTDVLFAQLVIGTERVGAPVVIQPMADRGMARSSGGPVQFQRSGSQYSGIRAYTLKNIVWETTEGEIEFRLRPDQAPNTAFNMMHLVEGGFYTDIIFHRVINKNQNGTRFMAQVGDPTGTGGGGPGYNIDLENSKLPHDFGVLSMARTSDPNTNGSQVFVCLSRDGTSFLDGQYTAFGEAVRGADVIDAIAATPIGSGDRPSNPPKIISAKLVDAPAWGTGPEVVKPAAKSESPR
jgi:peptidyl-prolyl cis-trans isomerase B (cyclophilin B)